mgnify:CR=1 FL=1
MKATDYSKLNVSYILNDLKVLEKKLKDIITEEIEQNARLDDLRQLQDDLYKVMRARQELED